MTTPTISQSQGNSVEPQDLLPQLNPWILLCEVGSDEFVIKNSRNASYFHAGAQEFFLLKTLKNPCTFSQLQQGFQEQFGEELQWNDVDDFLLSITRRGLVSNSLRWDTSDKVNWKNQDDDDEDSPEDNSFSENRKPSGSIFFYRVPLVNPDAYLSAIVRIVPWVWTRAFLLTSLGCLAFALTVMLSNRAELAASFHAALRWETLFLLGLTTLVVTVLHELAHGATCKRFGGEVREAGVLILMLMPCLYVNVSDAWLLADRKKRMLITAAGGYMDLCLWCIAVFAWRITLPGTLTNHLSFVVLTTCGTRGLINFNPLLRLDGYYLLSDFLRIPNLYSRGRSRWIKYLNCLLWGAPHPENIPQGKLLFFYGLVSWWFSIAFLNLVLINIMRYAGKQFGLIGFLFGGLLLIYALRRVFRGFLGVEFMNMIRSRTFRTTAWLAGIAVISALLYYIPTPYYTVGDFEVRPGDRVDVPVPLNSFISRVLVEDGSLVNEGDALVELQAPDLLSHLETKEAELKEAEANLARLKVGPRAEEVADQESRVTRMKAWCELGRLEVQTTSAALEHQLKALEHRVSQTQTQLTYAQSAYVQSQSLNKLGALADVQLQRERAQMEVLQERLGEVKSEQSGRATEGIRIAIAELSRREQELADAEGKLKLLKLGSRPEDIAAEEARRERLIEELAFLKNQRSRLIVVAPTNGYVSAPRLRERVGRYNTQGTLLCQVEKPGVPRVEIFVAEDDAMSVKSGQPVYFKARALPFETFLGSVERISPATAKPEDSVTSPQPAFRQTVVVHCRVDCAEGKLKSGMTGFGRVDRGWSTIGRVLLTSASRYVRTEFWW